MMTALPKMLVLSLLVVPMFMLGACVQSQPTVELLQSPSPATTTMLQKPDVYVTPYPAAIEMRVVFTEVRTQNNCGNSEVLEDDYVRSETIIHTAEVGGGITLSAEGKVSGGLPAGMAEVEVSVGSQIAATYKQEYGRQETLATTLKLRTPARTHMEFTIAHVEKLETGMIVISLGEQELQYPYRYRQGIALQQTDSRDIGCPTEMPTVLPDLATPTTAMPSTATPTSEPLPTTGPLYVPIALPSNLTNRLSECDLESWPTGMRYFDDVPINFEEGLFIRTQYYDQSSGEGRNMPEDVRIVVDAYDVERAYLLVNLSYACGDVAPKGRQVGALQFLFDGGAPITHELIVGENVREWTKRKDGEYGFCAVDPVQFLEGSDAPQEVWREDLTIEGVYRVMDLAVFEIPDAYAGQRLTDIVLRDLSWIESGSNNPGIVVFGVTVLVR